MWYYYQIINKFNQQIKAESYEHLDNREDVKKIAQDAMSVMNLNPTVYIIKILPVNENFELNLKNHLLRFNVHKASVLVLKISEFRHAGGSLNSFEKKLLDQLEERITKYEDSCYDTLTH